jgi:hypothetical protein
MLNIEDSLHPTYPITYIPPYLQTLGRRNV